MSSVSLFLITIAAIFLIGVIGELVFERTGVPDVVWLIVVGIVLGPLSGLVDRESLTAIAPYFGALTLVIVLFDGGTGLRLRELGPATGRATLLALLSFAMAVATLAPLSMLAARWGLLPAGWTWLHGVILGAILGGSSSVVIMPALRTARLDPRLASVINLESALTDVLCVVVTVATIQIVVTGATGPRAAAVTLGKSFGIGLGVGAAAGLLALLALKKLKKSRHAYPLILGTLLLLYVLIEYLGGSAALGILTMAVLVGNAPALSDIVGLTKSARLSYGVENAHDQLTFIVKSFFFTFIGAMLGPPWAMVGLGCALGVGLFLARLPAVAVGTVGAGLPFAAKGLVGVAMPRGMAAGVLAMLPAQAGVPGTERLPVVVFAAVVTTILVFAVGFPLCKRRLPAAPDGTPDQASPPGEAASPGAAATDAQHPAPLPTELVDDEAREAEPPSVASD